MTKTLKQIINMKADLWVNAFFFYFRRLWLIGKWMPEAIYKNYELKKVLAVFAVIFQQFKAFFGKPIYLLAALGLPFLMMGESSPELKEQGFVYMVQIVFFLNCLQGAFGDSQIFTVTRDKITCIKYLHMNSRTYLQGFLAFKYIPFFLYFLPWILLASWILGGSVLQGFFVWLMLFSFRMMSEALHLVIFDRTGKVISRNAFYGILLSVSSFAGAYGPILFKWNFTFGDILIHPACVALYTALGIFCFWYITKGYAGYEAKFHRSLDMNFLLSNMMKASSGSNPSWKEVEVKEKDVNISETDKEKVKSAKGYTYLNAMFFARHRRQLVKPVYYRLLIVGAALLAVTVLFFLNRETAVKMSRNLTGVLPFFVYIMYFMTVADKASRAMFYNCDKDMLHYAYYRNPGTILKNFRIRLLRVSVYDLIIAGALCLAAAAFCLLCGTPVLTMDFLLFCAAILLLSILFTAHHLCLYYIFQPYSESLQVKNPFYSVINGVMYFLCFLCLQIDVGGLMFTSFVLAFTIIYIVGALILVYRMAPKTFRVK